MKKIDSLKELVEFNNTFKTSVNLYLSLNKKDKILSYIPTKSSVNFLGDFLKSVYNNKEQATLFIGPYGKGKSHLLLVLLAILSLERNSQNEKTIKSLIKNIATVEEIGVDVSDVLNKVWKKKPFLPVLISCSNGDLNQAFLFALNDAIKRAGLTELTPETYYSIAINRLDEWKDNYPSTYDAFEESLNKYGKDISSLKAELKMYSKDALDLFTNLYPLVTAGSKFNPMADTDVLSLYKSISEQIVENYGYSGIYIVFDEFSKFIESQDGVASGNNMKLLQDICELASDSKAAQVYITMVAHKSIKEYGKYLSPEIINSFTGIEGRLIEKYFVTSSKNNYELIRHAIIKDESKLELIPNSDKYFGEKALSNYYQLPAFRSNFSAEDFENTVMRGCYPLNPIASYLLLNISEKVAQNERTLFTFISNSEPNSLAKYVELHYREMNWSVGADLIYDYFSSLFKKEIINENIHNVWLSAEYALERCKSEEERKIVKALAIILIVNKEDEIAADDKYLSLCVECSDPSKTINDLNSNLLIYKKSSTGTYAFKTKAGIELKAEIKKQRGIKGDNVNFSNVLEDVTGKHYVIPRRYNTIHMMTRYFVNQFMSVDEFLGINSSEALLSDCEADGKIITLYSFDKINQNEVKKHFTELNNPKIVVTCPKEKLIIRKQLKDYEIIQELKKNQTFITNNEILKRELPILIEDISIEVEDALYSIYGDNSESKVFYISEGKVKTEHAYSEEAVVNGCCEEIYFKSPVVNNEMVNRRIITTSQTRKARLNIIQTILNHEITNEFYEGSSQEATIYRSLFCKTGIQDGSFNDSIKGIIEEINGFIDSCSDTKNSLTKIINKLTDVPYGFRGGLIPFYLAYVISERREDIIVYFSNKEVQLNAEMIVNMCEKPNDYAIFVSEEDILKEKYIDSMNRLFLVEDNRNLSANRIKNIIICMQRWFRALPQVSRNGVLFSEYTDDSSVQSSLTYLKKVLQKVEFNPYEILFVDLPESFGTDSLEEVFNRISQCKLLYDNHFEWIQDKVVNWIYEIYGGHKKKDLYRLLIEWHESQSMHSKQGLSNGRMINYMSTLQTLNVYNDREVAMKVVKSVTDVYLENWNTDSMSSFSNSLLELKKEVESIKDNVTDGEMILSFTGKNGDEIKKIYNHADSNIGSVLRNILEDTLDEYDDLSVNDRVSILLDMIERIIK